LRLQRYDFLPNETESFLFLALLLSPATVVFLFELEAEGAMGDVEKGDKHGFACHTRWKRKFFFDN
jgi:hypothetical protein